MPRDIAYVSLLATAATLLAACGEDPELTDISLPEQTERESAPPVTDALVVTLEQIDASLQALASEDATARNKAEQELVAAGARAAPRLLERVAEGNSRVLAAAPNALKAMGPDAVPHLRTALSAGDSNQRVVAVMALLLMGRDAAGAADVLAAARSDPDPRVRAAAEHAYKRAIGDTSDIDRQRAENEEALRRSNGQ